MSIFKNVCNFGNCNYLIRWVYEDNAWKWEHDDII